MKSLSKTGLFHLLVVYIIWGSTYLAIRVAVRPGSGFSPFWVGLIRAFIASGVLFLIAALARQRLRLSRRELLIFAALGLLFWLGGNGLVMVAEQRADSGLAALVVASVPIWAEIIQAALARRLPSLLLAGSLLLGMGGIVVLTMPLIQSGLRGDVLSVVALLVGACSWAGGTVLSSRSALQVAPAVTSAWQLLFGGLGFLTGALLLGEPVPTPAVDSALAVGYLVVFGSLIGFTSFTKALKLLPTNIVNTHGYVNPIIAVFLGWLILGERISPWTVSGAALVLLGVYGVFRAHARDGNLPSSH